MSMHELTATPSMTFTDACGVPVEGWSIEQPTEDGLWWGGFPGERAALWYVALGAGYEYTRLSDNRVSLSRRAVKSYATVWKPHSVAPTTPRIGPAG